MTNDTMLIKKNSITQRKSWMNFISYIQTNHANLKMKLHSCKHVFSKKEVILWMCQRSNFNQFTMSASKFTVYWLKLINNLVKIWFKSDSGLTQIWLNLFFLSQHLLHLHHILSVLQHVFFESSAVFKHYINKSSCITLFLYS